MMKGLGWLLGLWVGILALIAFVWALGDVSAQFVQETEKAFVHLIRFTIFTVAGGSVVWFLGEAARDTWGNSCSEVVDRRAAIRFIEDWRQRIIPA